MSVKVDRGLSTSQNKYVVQKLLSINFPMLNKNSLEDDVYTIYECVEQIKEDVDNYSKYLKSIIKNR